MPSIHEPPRKYSNNIPDVVGFTHVVNQSRYPAWTWPSWYNALQNDRQVSKKNWTVFFYSYCNGIKAVPAGEALSCYYLTLRIACPNEDSNQ